MSIEEELINFLNKIVERVKKGELKLLDLKKINDLAVEHGLDVGNVSKIANELNKLIEDKYKEVYGDSLF